MSENEPTSFGQKLSDSIVILYRDYLQQSIKYAITHGGIREVFERASLLLATLATITTEELARLEKAVDKTKNDN